MALLRWFGVGWSFVLAAASVSACGESDGGSRRSGPEGGTSGATGRGGSGGTAGNGGSAGGSTAADWIAVCERTAETRCQKMEECVPYLHSVAPADCGAWAARLCEEMVQDAYVDLPFTPAEYERCSEASNQLSCDDAFYNLVIPPECTFAGGRPSGSPCDVSGQCDNGWCSTATECGECESYAELGEPCLLGICGAGLMCDLTFTCVPTRLIGDACSEEEPCLSTLVCEGGVCARPPAPGEPCSTLEQWCDTFANAHCNFTTLECESFPTANPGEPCTDTDVMCLGGSFCNRSIDPPTCELNRLEGEPCNGTDELCEVGLACTDGICTKLNPERCE